MVQFELLENHHVPDVSNIASHVMSSLRFFFFFWQGLFSWTFHFGPAGRSRIPEMPTVPKMDLQAMEDGHVKSI